MTNSTIKTKNRIFAIPTAVPAIPPKPRMAAISAMMRNVMAQESMVLILSVGYELQCHLRNRGLPLGGCKYLRKTPRPGACINALLCDE